jgi:hypothetical protein
MTPEDIINLVFKVAFGIAAVCLALSVFLVVLAI